MKKLLIIVTVLCIGIISNAQTFLFGIKGGAGESWIMHSIDGEKNNTAWNAGFSFMYRNKSHIGVGADVLYSAEGAKYYYITEPSGFINEHLQTNYIRLPLKVIYFFGKDKSILHPYVDVGPNIGVLTASQSSLISDGVKTQFNTKDDVNHIDFGASAEAGLNIKLAQKILLNADVAYYRGLKDVIKSDGKKNLNENVQFNIGVVYALKK